MPSYILEIPSVHEAIVRPLMKKLADDVLDNFGFTTDKYWFVFNGLNDAVVNNNSTIHDNQKRDNRFIGDHRIEIEFDEEVINPVNVAMLRHEQAPIFLDKETRVWLKPIYVQSMITIDFKLVVRDQTTATLWKRRAEMQAYRMMNAFMTDVDYHYQVPLGFVKQLWVIHTLMTQSDHPTDLSFADWLATHFTKRMTTIHNQAGNDTRLVIAEKQARIQGHFTFEFDVSKVEKLNESGAWSTGFSLEVYFDRPHAIVMEYPLVIHNTLIPPEYRDDDPKRHTYPTNYQLGRSASLYDMRSFEFDEERKVIHSTKGEAVVIPHFDDWLPYYVSPHYVNVSRILVQVDIRNPRDVLTLNDETLEDYALLPRVYEYLKDCSGSIFTLHDCLYMVSLHEWENLINPASLNVDSDLSITTRFDLKVRNMYHLVVDVIDDLTYLSPLALRKLSFYPDLVSSWCEVFLPYLRGKALPMLSADRVDMEMLLAGFKTPSGWWTTKDTYTDEYGNNPNGSGGTTGRFYYKGKWGVNKVNQFNLFAYRKGDNHGDHERVKEFDEVPNQTSNIGTNSSR